MFRSAWEHLCDVHGEHPSELDNEKLASDHGAMMRPLHGCNLIWPRNKALVNIDHILN
jgi:hypothetical protein